MSRQKTERNKQIVERRNNGERFKKIAFDMGLSPQRVSYIYCHEMDRTNGWAKLREGKPC